MGVTYIDPIGDYNAATASSETDGEGIALFVPSTDELWIFLDWTSPGTGGWLRVDMASRAYVAKVDLPTGITGGSAGLLHDTHRDIIVGWSSFQTGSGDRGMWCLETDGTERWVVLSSGGSTHDRWYPLAAGPDTLYAIREHYTSSVRDAITLVALDPTDGTATDLYSFSLSPHQRYGAVADDDDNLWLGLNGDVVLYDRAADTLTTVHTGGAPDDATRLFYDSASHRVAWFLQDASAYGEIVIYDIATASVHDTVTLDATRRQHSYDIGSIADAHGGYVSAVREYPGTQNQLIALDAEFGTTLQVDDLMPLVGDYDDAYTEWYPKSPAYRRTTSEIWFRVSWESSSGDPDYEFTSGYQVAIWTPDAAGARRQQCFP